MTHAKFNFNQLMITLIFGIGASEPPPRAWRTTEKAGPDRVKLQLDQMPLCNWATRSREVYLERYQQNFELQQTKSSYHMP